VKYLVAILLIFKPLIGHSQGTFFQNLDFESATVPPSGQEPYGTFVPIGSALPGWTAYLGAQQQTQVSYNSLTLSTANISLLGPTWNSSDNFFEGVGIIDGNYTIVLQAGAAPTNINFNENASIAQNGLVPSTAESIQFKAFSLDPISVSFAGNALDPIALSSGLDEEGMPYTLYGANISAWAGQTGQLEFTTGSGIYDPYLVLDDIAFSTNSVVPEPSTLALLLMTGVAFGVLRWRARTPRGLAHNGAAE
jgi:hypothetical protein